MPAPNDQTSDASRSFDFSAYPTDTLFLDRRSFPKPGDPVPEPAPAKKPRKERRKRIDPTTFDKQYSIDEIEFMNAVQSFKLRAGKSFPSHRDVLDVALRLGYRKVIADLPAVPDSE